MKYALSKTLIYASAMGLISSFAIISSAWAGDMDCPLHKRLASQQASSYSVIMSASLKTAPQEPDFTIVSATSPIISSLPLTSSKEVSPSIMPTIDRSESKEDNIIIKESQNSYGSATPDVDIKACQKPSPHAVFTAILNKYVSALDGQGLTHFNYGGLKANKTDKAALDSYIKGLEAVNPNSLSTNAAIAYYANLYNAVTVQIVTENYPLKSIRKLGAFNSGPWKKDLFTINGMPASLDKVEHGILRKKFASPYIHYMVNCASVGCPNLPQAAWEADSLEHLRVQAARDYINSPRGVIITPRGLKVSSIFKWFKEDFGGNEQNILKHIREHANTELVAAIDKGARITDYGYDWSLND